MSLLSAVVFSSGVFVASCFYFEKLRRDFPESIVQHQRRSFTNEERSNTVSTAIVNLCIGGMLLMLFYKRIHISNNQSNWIVELAKLAAMFFISDTMFYWSHRFLHIPQVFRVAHAQHHSHNEPIAWTSLYVHPVEFMIAFFSIFIVPLLLFRLNPLTATLFLSGIMISLTSSHSGINLGVINASHHDLHHQRRRGNYGSDIGVWDWLCGTSLEPR